MPFKLGTTELIVILVIVLVIFGAGKLPQVARALGDAIREFRKGHSEEERANRSLESKTTEKKDLPQA